MFWKKWLRDYFSFGRRDRLGMTALIILILIIYLLPRWFHKPGLLPPLPDPVLAAALDSLAAKESNSQTRQARQEDHRGNFEPPPARGELFRFDPNQLNQAGWQRLGLSERTAGTIIKYLSKGGRFRRHEDLQKIWGLPKGFYERVKDFIVLEAQAGPQPFKPYETREARKPGIVSPVDLSTADSAALEALPGIGGRLASRIIGFREKLGGFYSVEQVGETYGLADSVFQKLKNLLRLSGSVRKFKLNTVTREELKAHPYFKWSLANAITAYRKQHGEFKSLEELRSIALIDEATFQRIIHYLEL